MRRRRRVKIVATLGPASEGVERMSELFCAGVDMFRINMSHASRDAMRERVLAIRELEKRFDRPVGILADLQGPKLRIGAFASGSVELERGQRFTLDASPEKGSSSRVHLPHPEILISLEPGHVVLLDDGKLALRILEATPERAVTEVVTGGKLSDRKGVSVPDTVIPITAMTEKDRSDAEAAVDAGVDWIAVSFVQRPEDVAEVKKLARGQCAVLAKIEKPQAVARFEEIMETADAVMVARGDLGVEVPLEKVPGIQKRITRLTRRTGKPVVIATQMLESMIASPVPTRAEVSDVATAVFEGADAVMLSAESAAGQYPVEAVAMMNGIAEEVEGDPNHAIIIAAQRSAPEATGADAIAAAARSITETVGVSAIIAWSESGATALRIARERPELPILVLTPNVRTARRLAIAWGVHAVVTDDAHDLDDMVNRAVDIARKEDFVKPGERVIIIAGLPFGTPGATNMIRVAFAR
ncbi:MAG: pyruvate kinase [Hyphomicrobiales bacterium]|nr:pyruvate kinase [Hyphomicrobiales bacterium]MBV8764070.1 pyruvate kinase [Hyphomicrobiales bacterium]MBV9431857.1 pyruvate kinase [Hyphomicrobiales bacterium]MBV9739216.1 pyruvate kinase [Hyphomicrobiales bacterium]